MFNTCKKVGSSFILSMVMLMLAVGVPVNLQGIQRAEALYSVDVKFDTSPTSIANLAETVTTAAENIQQTYFASWEVFKEKVLDPLFWMLANQMISNMLSNLTQWINSGFQGSPAFVTDLEGFLQDAVDQAVGQFINESDELGFLCSPYALDVKLALDLQYQASKSFGENQCTLTDVVGNLENFIAGNFSEGGWAGWFELSVSPTNDPNRAFLEGRTYAGLVGKTTREREFGVLQANEFFLNVQACETVDTPAGPQERCVDSTLGNIVQDQFIKVTGAPVDKITFADEFDEVLGALMGQFVNQMLTGVNGLLGMGGTSYASGGGYGAGGEGSYLEALTQEAANQTNSSSTDPIGEAIDLQLEYAAALQEIVNMVDAVEIELENARNRYPSCFNLRMSPELTDARDDAEEKMRRARAAVDLFLTFEEELENTTSPRERTEVLSEFHQIYADIYARTTADMASVRTTVEYVLPRDIAEFEDAINDEERRCERRTRNRFTNPNGR